MHKDNIKSIQWNNQTLILLDQRILPKQVHYLELRSVAEVVEAIKTMAVRGAPAIGIVAAYGVVLAAMSRYLENPHTWQCLVEQDMALLRGSRPTAVNLHWALERMKRCIEGIQGSPVDCLQREARTIHQEDLQNNYKMASQGAELVGENANIITHCNTGSLATGGYGTALGVIRTAFADGKLKRVYAGETRPWLQGARLTVWELTQDKIPVTLMCDSSAAFLFKTTDIQWLIVGADRIAANGDVANKIGTYSLAVLAKQHDAKVMVVAPSSTVDLTTEQGCDIPIEYRDEKALFNLEGGDAGLGIDIWNPVFDITPAALVDVLVTEKGILPCPDKASMASLFSV